MDGVILEATVLTSSVERPPCSGSESTGILFELETCGAVQPDSIAIPHISAVTPVWKDFVFIKLPWVKKAVDLINIAYKFLITSMMAYFFIYEISF